jgi:glycosyltransferase involved in cell wall biosynthesis
MDDIALQDNRVRVIHQQRMGLAKTLNNLIAMCNSPYIARHDSDDYSHPERFARQVAFLEQHRNIMLLGTSCCLVDENNKELLKERLMTGS